MIRFDAAYYICYI